MKILMVNGQELDTGKHRLLIIYQQSTISHALNLNRGLSPCGDPHDPQISTPENGRMMKTPDPRLCK